VAIVLIVLGAAGVVLGAIVLQTSGPASGGVAPAVPGPSGSGGTAQLGGSASNGERIYYTGVGRVGVIPRAGGQMMAAACVNCHGANGRGGRIAMMMGFVIDVPDIRYATLTSPSEGTTGTVPGWTETQIADAIRNGVEPDGKKLDSFMPRWDMDATDMADTIDYLKELSRR
jgi:cytochrome c553